LAWSMVMFHLRGAIVIVVIKKSCKSFKATSCGARSSKDRKGLSCSEMAHRHIYMSAFDFGETRKIFEGLTYVPRIEWTQSQVLNELESNTKNWACRAVMTLQPVGIRTSLQYQNYL
jgi:hypothetical protein